MDHSLRAQLRDPNTDPQRLATDLIRAHGAPAALIEACVMRAQAEAPARGRARAAYLARGGCPYCGGTGTYLAPAGLDPRRRWCPRRTGKLCTQSTRMRSGYDPTHTETPAQRQVLDYTPAEQARIAQLDAVIAHIRAIVAGP